MDNKDVIHTHIRILFSCKKKGNYENFRKTEGAGKYNNELI